MVYEMMAPLALLAPLKLLGAGAQGGAMGAGHPMVYAMMAPPPGVGVKTGGVGEEVSETCEMDLGVIETSEAGAEATATAPLHVTGKATVVVAEVVVVSEAVSGAGPKVHKGHLMPAL